MDKLSALQKVKTRITFDFTFEVKGERSKSYEKLAQIICAARWGTGIDIFGFLNDEHRLLFDFIDSGAIVIDECEYEIQEPYADKEAVRNLKTMLGKRSTHHALRDMATLFADEPYQALSHYRNTIYLPNLNAFARADGIKPENITEMLSLRVCDKIILFPYFPLDGKSAYYEITLAVQKESFVEYMDRRAQRKADAFGEMMMQIGERIVNEKRNADKQ